jgi:hypothetical protein
MREAAFERTYGIEFGRRPWRVKPQEWNRDEISSAGLAGSNALRGCETLRAPGTDDLGCCRVTSSAKLAKR